MVPTCASSMPAPQWIAAILVGSHPCFVLMIADVYHELFHFQATDSFLMFSEPQNHRNPSSLPLSSPWCLTKCPLASGCLNAWVTAYPRSTAATTSEAAAWSGCKTSQAKEYWMKLWRGISDKQNDPMQYLTTEITEIVLDLLDHSQYAKHALTHLVADSANVRKAWKAWKDYIDCPLFYYGRAIHISSYFHRLPTWPRHCPGQDHNELCHRFALPKSCSSCKRRRNLGTHNIINISNPNGTQQATQLSARARSSVSFEENIRKPPWKTIKRCQKMSKRCPKGSNTLKKKSVMSAKWQWAKGIATFWAWKSRKSFSQRQALLWRIWGNHGKPTCSVYLYWSVLKHTETIWNHWSGVVPRLPQAAPSCPKLPQAACPLPLKDVSAKRLRLSPGSCSMLRQASNKSI